MMVMKMLEIKTRVIKRNKMIHRAKATIIAQWKKQKLEERQYVQEIKWFSSDKKVRQISCQSLTSFRC